VSGSCGIEVDALPRASQLEGRRIGARSYLRAQFIDIGAEQDRFEASMKSQRKGKAMLQSPRSSVSKFACTVVISRVPLLLRWRGG